MQSERYRAKYIEPITGEERLPVSIARLPGDGTILPDESSAETAGAAARANG
jgi:hypothetical protein